MVIKCPQLRILVQKIAPYRLYVACKNCVSPDSPDIIFKNRNKIPKEDKLRVIRNAVKSGHTSVLEHAQVTFTVSDISRVCGQMLKAYRHSSSTQKSQRYVAAKDKFEFVIPETINNIPSLKKEYKLLMQKAANLYKTFVDNGVPAEDARYVYPLSVTTSTVTSLNLRELVFVENERLCNRAQQEMRELAKAVRKEILKKEPWLEEFLVPKCIANGKCTEIRKCGKSIDYNA